MSNLGGPGRGPREGRTARGHATRTVHDPRTGAARDDEVAVEEPLEIRVGGEAVAVTMRTPGDDGDLALGFLFGEGVLARAADAGSVFHCGRPGEEGYGNVIDVAPGAGAALPLDRLEASRRGTLTTAACGVCGRRTVADLLERLEPVPAGAAVAADVVVRAVEELRAGQGVFARTGGTHAASVHERGGARLAFAEDVGRHNAVDKVVGALLRAGLVGGAAPGEGGPALLVVSGRASFEMVQKAARARIPVLASVSAPTTLAVDLAREAGVTLAGFVRAGRLNVYAHPERILG